MKKTEVIGILNRYTLVKENKMVEKSVELKQITFVKLRDRLLGLGKILEENFENSYYVASIPSGFANKNIAVVLILLEGYRLSLYSYSREGLIDQHTSDKAIERIIEKVAE